MMIAAVISVYGARLPHLSGFTNALMFGQILLQLFQFIVQPCPLFAVQKLPEIA